MFLCSPKIVFNGLQTLWNVIFLLALIAGGTQAQSQTNAADLESSYRFLVNDRETGGGVLYLATAGKLQGLQLPLSFVDSAAYWGEYVCRYPEKLCAITDVFNPQTFALTPEKSLAGDLQTERINTHNGSNIYDAATWQIAVMLGKIGNRFSLPQNRDAYALVSNQNRLLQEGYNGNSSHAVASENRAVTAGKVFVYNQQSFTEATRAYVFRMLPKNWLATDPFMGTSYAGILTARFLPENNPEYQPGKVTWTDWKPITGENAWAFLLGPLQAASLHYLNEQHSTHVPLHDPALQNALAILPAFAAMQSASGGVYYAPARTVGNQGDQPVDPYEVAVENNFSLYAGLKILGTTLEAIRTHEKNLNASERATLDAALQLSDAMINGGLIGPNRSTRGLLSFFKNAAWHQGEFVQSGRADDPAGKSRWLPNLQLKAVDVNTWGISALGTRMIDQWFGFGAAYRNWQQVKQWGGYGVGKTLWGVGFSNQDGNGIDVDGNYRQGVLSTEWSAGAITMVREMIAHYQKVPTDSSQSAAARNLVATLKQDEQSMLAALTKLRIDTYPTAGFSGQPPRFSRLLQLPTRPYLYASKRYFVPFGWYANPLPSTCSTAWMIMVANHYNPFVYGGGK